MPSEDQLQRAVAQHREAEEAPGLTAEQLEIVNDRVRCEILKRQAIEERLQVSLRFLEIVHSHTDIDSLLASFVSEIKYYTGCEAVGLRVLDTDGSIPYQSYCGFSQEFYELESPFTLKADQCMCINVIKDDCDPGLPFYTSGGSFYSKGTTRLLAKVSEEDKGRTRDVCNREGYESVALIPIRRGDSCWNWTRRSRPLSLAATPKTRSCPSLSNTASAASSPSLTGWRNWARSCKRSLPKTPDPPPPFNPDKKGRQDFSCRRNFF